MLLAMLGTTLVLGGCSSIMGTTATHEPIPQYPEGPAGLQAFFTDVLTAAKKDDRDRVHDLFESLKMSPADLRGMFGDRATALQKPYDDMMATLINPGTVELVAIVYEKKYDVVEVGPMELTPAVGPARAEDQAITAALKEHPTLYFARLKRGTDVGGTRYAFLFYRDGKWRTGNFLGKVLAKRDAELTATASPR